MATTPISRDSHHDSHHGCVLVAGRWEEVALQLRETPGNPLKLEVRTASGFLSFDMSQTQLAVELSRTSLEVIVKATDMPTGTLHILLKDRRSLWHFITALEVAQNSRRLQGSSGRLGSPNIEVDMRKELDINLLNSILGRIKETQDALERTWGVLKEEA